MPRLCFVLFLFVVTSGGVSAQQSASVCPSFAPDPTIRTISPKDRVFKFDGGYAAVVHEIALDTDGSPVSYHPQNHGTTHLCNGLDPIVDGKRVSDKGPNSACYGAVRAAMEVNWDRAQSPSFCIYGFYVDGTKDPACGNDRIAWGGALGNGEIPRQGAQDPAQGFFISLTAAHNPGVSNDRSQAKYLDSDRTPYAVVPAELVARRALPRGGIAWGWNPQSGRTGAAVFGDTQHKFGEISIAFAQELEKGEISPIAPAALSGAAAIPWPYGKTKAGEVRLLHSPSTPLIFVYFAKPPATVLSRDSPDAISGAAVELINQNGGRAQLEQCLRGLVP